MTTVPNRRETAYWLTLAFHTDAQTRQRNGLVLTADRRAKLGMMDLLKIGTEDLPQSLLKYGEVHRQLLSLEGRTSAQAFLVDQILEQGVTVVPITSASYPRHVATRLSPERAPTVLFMAGDILLAANPGVAVSGARHAGAKGLAFARAVGRALAERGIPVISGLAKGVDTEAAEGALEAGGHVIGIAAEGILASGATRRKEVKQGRLLVVSQFAPNQRWAARLAMSRNATIAAFSNALIVADCVGPGGTSDQVSVHRKHGLPVFIRRGDGEGAYMPILAHQPGVAELFWDNGDVVLPSFEGESPIPLIECRISRGEKLSIELWGPAELSLEAVLAAIRENWPGPGTPVSRPHGQGSQLHEHGVGIVGIEGPVAAVVGSSVGAVNPDLVTDSNPQHVMPSPGSREPSVPTANEENDVLSWIGEGCTLTELQQRSGLTNKRLKAILNTLDSKGVIERRQLGRRLVYLVRGSESGPGESPSAEQTALKLIEPKEGER